MATDTIQTHLSQSYGSVSWRRRKLNTLIFFVTSHCNSTCDTCFYWDELNRSGDLDWKEIVRLSETMPQLTDLWFSGGEPTLRADLEDIIDLFVSKNGVRHINLPTNGLKPRRIYEIVERSLRTNPRLQLHVNIALDGLKDYHDTMRGVPGNFEKAIESARMLRTEAGHGRLEVHINTVITRDNIDEVHLAEWVFSERLVDGHYFNLIRGNARIRLKELTKEKLRKLYPAIADCTRYASIDPGSKSLLRWLKRMAYVGTLTFTTGLSSQTWKGTPVEHAARQRNLRRDRLRRKVRSCDCGAVADLRKMDMQFKVFWESPARTAETKQIKCDCAGALTSASFTTACGIRIRRCCGCRNYQDEW
jgi:MoaA/NifB/PqqE/SkfB family radical SAM enzyme